MTTLQAACSRVDYGFTASADHDSAAGPRFLRITDIDRSFIDWASVPRCNATDDEARKYALSTGDVVVARTGASTGRSQWVEVSEPSVFASYLVRFRADPKVLESRYLGYVLTSAPWKQFISASAHGKSAQPNLSASAMAAFEFEMPDLFEQRGIAEVLGALDDKIAANSTLRAAADELSRVRFESLLPGGDTAPLSSLARFVNGKAFTKDASGTGRVVIRIAELNSGLGGPTVYNDLDVADDYLARPGDLLFAWSGSLTVHRWYRDEGIINQHIFKVIPTEAPMWVVKGALDRKLAEFRAVAADKATTMGHIQRRHLDEPVMIPAAERIETHGEAMSALWRRALSAEQESLQLEQFRDALLPQLMSGKIRVKDAERVVEGVV